MRKKQTKTPKPKRLTLKEMQTATSKGKSERSTVRKKLI